MKPAFVLILTMFIFLPYSAAAEGIPPCFIEIDEFENTISADIDNMNIEDVVRLVSEKSGIKILLDQTVAHTVKSEFRDMPLEVGIKKIIGTDIDSSFIFLKKRSVSGEITYHLDTVKIFGENILLTTYKVFDGNVPDGKLQVSESSEIMKLLAKKNVEIMREKSSVETERVTKKIHWLKMKLGQNPSIDDRVELTKKLSQARQELSKLEEFKEIVKDEEENLRKIETFGQKKLAGQHKSDKKLPLRQGES
ncbi:hypothetical protein QUF80_03330 [Desulfococcaceae bacterium HSG8]|nr:hypothetical protein [Desulfococcaceae bacterium HSG8]